MSEVRVEKLPYLAADFGESSPLPDLHNVSYVHSTVTWDESLTEEDVRYMRYGRVSSILPYPDLNRYTREKKEKQLNTVVLSNEHVRAEILPWMGGRLWSLVVDGREVLSHNPVVQPCNLALRNAWCSGGVEWNVSIRGHNMLTCDNMFTELLELPDGTAGVRLYEFERIRGIVFRIEMYLPKDSRFLFVQNHIENPKGNGTVPMYWWSNIAVPEESETRVIAPAKTAVLSLYGAGQYMMLRRKLPFYEEMDLSKPCKISRSVDVFFDLEPGVRPYIAALGNDQTGLVQCSTARQLGRKLFVWGMGQGGRHWQEFLSDGKTRYIEIQAGIAKTQQDHIPMPDGETWEWLEAYGRMECNVAGLDYAAARAACDRVLDDLLPQSELNAEFAGRGKQIANMHGKLVLLGSGWGAVENRLRREKNLPEISSVCRFPEEAVTELQTPWLNLLETGTMPSEGEFNFPKSYVIKPEWKEMLEKAPQNGLVAYYRGVIAHAEGRTEDARTLFENSLKMAENAPAHRALARICALEGNQTLCLAHYDAALKLQNNLLPLKLEFAQTLLSFEKYQELVEYLATLPECEKNMPRFLYLKAAACVGLAQYEEAQAIMEMPLIIPDMREGELSLCDLWFTLFMKKENITREEAEAKHPLPQILDFRMH